MDELIQRQLRERELDITNITKTFQQNAINVPPMHMNKPPILSIQEEIKMDSYDVIDEPVKKRVTWSMEEDTNDNHKSSYQNTPIKIVEELSEKFSLLMEFLEKKIPDFQKEYDTFSTKKIIQEILEEQIERII
jgi:hypothetical protein